MRGTIHQLVNWARLLLTLAFLLCAVPMAQALRCATPGPVLNFPVCAEGHQRLNEEMPSPKPDACYVVWIVDSEGRIGLFVGNNPINRIDPYGLVWYNPVDWYNGIVDAISDPIARLWTGGIQAQGNNAVNTMLSDHGYNGMQDYQMQHPGYGGDITAGNTDASAAIANIASGSANLYVTAATMVTPTAAGTKCTSELAERLMNANRVGSGLKADASHRAASFLTKAQLEAGQTFAIQGADGVQRTLLQTPGVFNGKQGIYEYILDPSGVVTHQRFINGGVITGVPNQ